MTRSRWTLAAAPLLALALLGAGCGDDEPADDGPDVEQPGSQTNSDESVPETEAGADDGSDGGGGQSDGEDGSGSDEGTNRDSDAPTGQTGTTSGSDDDAGSESGPEAEHGSGPSEDGNAESSGG